MLPHETLLFAGFILFVLLMLAVDLGVFNRDPHKITIRESLIWSGVWIGLSLLFALGLWYFEGTEPTLKYISGYLIEKSLSMDNLFVFLVIFQFFKVDKIYRHKVLFWGIIGALVFRAAFIFAGVAILNKFQWLVYLLGAFLIYTGIKLARETNREIEPEQNPILKLMRRIFPVTENYRGGHFFVREAGKLFVTPLFIVLVAIETTDIMFAVDSIPAILAISRDPFIVFSSNVFAILGLRALFFALSGIMQLFEYLHYGLAAILMFVGIKMLISELVHIPVWIALSVIAVILTVTIIASVRHSKQSENVEESGEKAKQELGASKNQE